MRQPLAAFCSRRLLPLILAAVVVTPALAANPNPGVLPPHSNPHGLSYAEWSTAWWQWFWAAPPSANAGLDETGASIPYGQGGSVWFLAPNFGGTTVRSATIPAGRSLFIQLGAFFGSPLIGDPATEPELRAVLAGLADQTTVACELDGVPLAGLQAYRVASPELFEITLPDDNMLTFFGIPTPAGTYGPAASDGYFVMVAPLPAGQHTIRIRNDFPDPFVDNDVTVHLTVAGGKGPANAVLTEDGSKSSAAPRTSWGALKALYRSGR